MITEDFSPMPMRRDFEEGGRSKKKINSRRFEVFMMKKRRRVMKVGDVYGEGRAHAQFLAVSFFSALGWEIEIDNPPRKLKASKAEDG